MTATAQRGTLARFPQADFGSALVLAPGVTGLETMPRVEAPQPLIEATSTFDFRAGTTDDGLLEVATLYRGREADSMRAKLRTRTLKEHGDEYLNYYKRRYAGAERNGALTVSDDPSTNELAVRESHRLAHAFEEQGNGGTAFELNADFMRTN